MRLKKTEKKYPTYLLVAIIGTYSTTVGTVLPYNAAAITTLNMLEGNGIEQDYPHFDTGEKGNIPSDIDVNWLLNKAYVANTDSDTVSVIDGETLKVLTVDVGDAPVSIAVNSLSDTAYVANRDSGTVSVIDGETLKVSTVNVGYYPASIDWDSSGTVYVANTFSDTVSVIDGDTLKVLTVNVGNGPTSISVHEEDDTVYVANTDSDTVSVIDGETLNVSTVNVGNGPTSIAVNSGFDRAYVSHEQLDSVSVINGTDGNYRNIANITVGSLPTDIDIHRISDTTYVANRDSGTVSVIDGYTLNVKTVNVGDAPESIAVDESDNIAYITDITDGSGAVSVIDGDTLKVLTVDVGDAPVSIAVDQSDKTESIAYVANLGNTVSIISGTSQQVQAGVSFDVNPFHAGRIECSNSTVPTNQYFYVDFRTQCTAQANQGFQFSNWVENLERNSSRTISTSQGDWFTNTLDWISGKPSPATLNVTKFGNFTANFERSPPTIPPEYIATLFTVVITAFIGSWLTPTVVAWRKTKNDARKMNYYHQRITSLEDDGRLNKNDIEPLGRIRREVLDTYSKGRINENQYVNLRNEISVLYEKIYRKIIDSINSTSDNTKEKQLVQLMNEIENAYSEGRIIELHYNLLNKKIESSVNTDENKKSKLQDMDET